jgi:hypothetical protein
MIIEVRLQGLRYVDGVKLDGCLEGQVCFRG